MTAGGPRLAVAGRIGAYAPVPFVGASAILVALIVFTPVLLSGEPSPLATQAEIVVYRVTGGPVTDFYVHAVDPTVPYWQIDVALGTGFTWSGGCPTSGVSWGYHNETDALGLATNSSSGSIVLHARAVYNSTAGSTVYEAEFAFNLTHFGQPDESLSIVPCTSATPGATGPGSWPVARLPVPLFLVDYGSGGPP